MIESVLKYLDLRHFWFKTTAYLLIYLLTYSMEQNYS